MKQVLNRRETVKVYNQKVAARSEAERFFSGRYFKLEAKQSSNTLDQLIAAVQKYQVVIAEGLGLRKKL